MTEINQKTICARFSMPELGKKSLKKPKTQVLALLLILLISPLVTAQEKAGIIKKKATIAEKKANTAEKRGKNAMATIRQSASIMKLLKKKMSMGERIAFWANSFIDTPYDTDPLGIYVRQNRIIVDETADCMYLVFRCVELALANSPEDSEIWGLKLRFFKGGLLDEEGFVTNYDERFQYGRMMIDSGRWGREITPELGEILFAPGTKQAGPDLAYIPSLSIAQGKIEGLKPGDIIYFVKDPQKRVVGEIIGHMGIIDIKEGIIMLIHASGSKKSTKSEGGGQVKILPLAEYMKNTGFIGASFTRMDLVFK